MALARRHVFKYAPRQYNRLLTVMGCVRVGTLYDFRRSEHRKGIADPQEGKKRVHHGIESLNIVDSNDPKLKDNKDFRALEAFKIFDVRDSKNIRIEGITVARQFDVPDCFIYCLSKASSTRLYREFEGSNSQVEIIDPIAFFRTLTLSLNSLVAVTFRGIHDVRYTSREETWNGSDWGHHPALIKELNFAPQAEVRAIWTPQFTSEIQPMVVGHSELPGHCRMIDG
jgi:hypothetical protein